MRWFLFVLLLGTSPAFAEASVDSTGTAVYFNNNELTRLPAYGVFELAGLQTGAVAKRGFLYLRGGRSDEVALYIDGILQRHPLTGAPLFDVAPTNADQVIVTTGGFSAEYGAAMSGTIHITTPHHNPSLLGSANGFTDRFSKPSFGYDALALSLGGPLVQNKTTFFASADWQDHADSDPRHGVLAHETERDKLSSADFDAFADGRLPHNRYNARTLRGHLSHRLNDRFQIQAHLTTKQTQRDHYIHSYRYNLAHAPTLQQRAHHGTVTLRYTPDPKTIFTAQLSATTISDHQGDGTHQKDLAAYVRITGNPGLDNERLFYRGDEDSTAISTNADGFIIGDEGRVYNEYIQQNIRTYTPINIKLTHQIAPNHTLRTGLELNLHHLRRYQHLSPGFRGPSSSLNVVRYGYDYNSETNSLESSASTYDNAKRPITGAFFLQNRAEYDGLIVTVGMRLDYLNPRDQAVLDPSNPFGGGFTLDADEVKRARAQLTLSPRVGLYRAISDRTAFHAHYGIFRQLPPFQYLYTGLDYFIYRASQARTVYAFGNPELSLPRTSAFEMGLNHQFSSQFGLAATIYLKRVVNLIQRTTINAQPANYDSYRNDDIATLRGFEITPQIKPTPGVVLNLSYVFSHATGTGFFSPTDINLSPGFQAFTGPDRSVPLLFERRHSLTASLTAQLPSNIWFSAIARTASGFPYTPSDPFSAQIGFFGVFPPGGAARSLRTPGFLQLDIKAGKTFHLNRLKTTLAIWALNLTDHRNVIAVYPATGQPNVSGWLPTEQGREFVDQFGETGRQSYEIKEQNPRNLGPPRQIRIGATFQF